MDRDCGIKDYFLSLPKGSRFDLFRKLRHEINQPIHVLMGYSGIINDKVPKHDELKNNPEIKILLQESMELSQVLTELSYYIKNIGNLEDGELENNLIKLEGLFARTVSPFSEVQIDKGHPKLIRYHSSMKQAKGCIKFTLSEIFNCEENEGFYFHQYLNLVSGLNKEIFDERGIRFYKPRNELITSLSYGSTLSSLIGNSIKHSRASEIRVNITERKSGQSYIVSVADNGRGINPNAIYRAAVEEGTIEYGTLMSDYQKSQLVFEKGVKTEYSNANGLLCNFGTSEGLGLSAIKDSIEGKGGQVWADNVSKGACFCFTVPKKLVIDYK